MKKISVSGLFNLLFSYFCAANKNFVLFGMKRLVLILIVLIVSSIVVLAQETITVFIAGDGNQSENKVFATRVAVGIERRGNFTANEQTDSFLELLADDTSYKQNGQISDNKISQIGKQLGADFVCYIMVSNILNEKYITTKLIRTETAEVVKIKDAVANWKDVNGLESAANNLAAYLLGSKKEVKKDIMKKDVVKPIQMQIGNQKYEVMPKDLDGTYSWTEAKDACDKLIIFGNDDWFLPSKEELEGIYKHRKEIGGFSGDWYWSATEDDSEFVWLQSFSDGYQGTTNQSFGRKVRCLRKE